MRTKRQETKEGILTGVHRKELSSFLCTPVSIPLSFLLRGIQESIGGLQGYQPYTDSFQRAVSLFFFLHNKR